MGTFAGYLGKKNIPKEKREEFSQNMLKLLNYGGMMQFENVNIYGKDVALIKVPSPDDEGRVRFHYNYFEDDGWETAEFDIKDCDLWSEKIGGDEFNFCIQAAYSLYEVYDENIGFAAVDGESVEAGECIGWINHVLGAAYSAKNRFKIWEYFERDNLGKLERGFDKKNSVYDILRLPPEAKRWAIGGVDFADICYIINGTESLSWDEVIPGSYPEAVLKCKDALQEFFASQQEQKIAREMIWDMLRMSKEARNCLNNELPQMLVNLSLNVPARAFVYLVAELQDLNFWELWKELKAEVYHDEDSSIYMPKELKEEREKEIESAVEPVTTEEFFYNDGYFTFYKNPKELEGKPNYYISDDERAYWWDGEEDFFSDEMEDCLTSLAERHRELTTLEDMKEYDNQTFLEEFIVTLNDINSFYKRVYAFRDMFYDFLMNYSDKNYIAAVKLLQEITEENKEAGKIIEKVGFDWDLISKNVTFNEGRRNMKRYLAVMANKKLRKKYFGF